MEQINLTTEELEMAARLMGWSEEQKKSLPPKLTNYQKRFIRHWPDFFKYKIIQEVNWPTEHRITTQSQRIYESGLDTVNMYRDHPAIFGEALRKFQGTESSPYAYAGIAYTLATASRGRGGQVPDQRGLKRAMHWLEKSQILLAGYGFIRL